MSTVLVLSDGVLFQSPEQQKRHLSPFSVDKNHHTNSDTGNLSCSDEPTEEDLILPEELAQRLVLRTEHKVSELLAKSRFIRSNCLLYDLPRFEMREMAIGDMIAHGGFSNVHNIISFGRGRDEELPRPPSCYVVKHLNPKLALNPRKLMSGGRDIFFEAHILASVSHKHILSLRGWSSGGVTSFATTGRADGFFLVFDRLESTLFNRLSQWRKRVREDETLNFIHKRKKYPGAMKLFYQRLKIARDVADALAYLHDRCSILHLDIKPGNVGFDQDGCVKLFDFGLAIEAQRRTKDPDETFALNGKKGTSRYMAPEVIRKCPYNSKADVYSFSILMNEILSLSKPYDGLEGDDVKELVSLKHLRPKIPKEWPSQLRKLLKCGWAKRTEDRPTMGQMKDILEKMLAALAIECNSFREESNSKKILRSMVATASNSKR